MDYSMVGPALALGLACLGSAIGCGIAGMTSHGVMARVEEGHGQFIAFSAAPSSQSIYGFILMLLMKTNIDAGTLSAASSIGIGFASGLAIMTSAIFQGRCCASAIQATAKQPSLFGKSWAAIGIVESFALFAFVFALMLM